MELDSHTLKRTTRIAGLLYLVWTATGIFGLIFIPARIDTRGDALSATRSILAHEGLFRLGLVNDVASSVVWILMALAFYRMFRHVNERLAKLLVAFVIVQIPIGLAMSGFNLAALELAKGALLQSFEVAQRQDVALLFLRMGDFATLTLEAFWGLWLFPLAILIYRSRFLPRFLGVWLTLTGVFYVIVSITGLLVPHSQSAVLNSPVALPIELSEVALMLWMLIRGAAPLAEAPPHPDRLAGV